MGSPVLRGGFLCGKFQQFVIKYTKEGHRAFPREPREGETGPTAAPLFFARGGVDGIGILGVIVKQTNQKKKGEWMNG
jgi:hypothetical protein